MSPPCAVAYQPRHYEKEAKSRGGGAATGRDFNERRGQAGNFSSKVRSSFHLVAAAEEPGLEGASGDGELVRPHVR